MRVANLSSGTPFDAWALAHSWATAFARPGADVTRRGVNDGYTPRAGSRRIIGLHGVHPRSQQAHRGCVGIER